MAKLGDLSATFESNGQPGAIGFDKVGGFSYGMYQIAANTGTMDRFLQYLQTDHPDMAQILQAAGGSTGARAGTAEFRAAWKQLASERSEEFAGVQHDFIKQTHYDVQAAKLLANFALNLDLHSEALRNVVWSMAVQHRGGTQTIFRNTLRGRDPAGLSDEDLIRGLYSERSKVNMYFASSTEAIKDAVRRRYQSEELLALNMLAAEGATPASEGAVAG